MGLTPSPLMARADFTTSQLPVYELLTVRAAIFTARLHGPQQAGPMADFLAVLGMVAFALVMLGLIWGLDRV